MSDVTTVNCPTCGKPVIWGEQSPFRPFCCKRCQFRAMAISLTAMTGAKTSSNCKSLLALRLAGYNFPTKRVMTGSFAGGNLSASLA